MFKARHQLLVQMMHFLAMARDCWHDSRVPLFGRILIVLAPIYLLCPFDLRPDYLPGGFYDDLLIVPLLVGAAIFLIPKVVFQDARKAALLTKRAAALGMLCVTVTGSSAIQDHPVQFLNSASACHAQQNISLGSLESSPGKEQSANVLAKNYSQDSQQRIGPLGNGYLAVSCTLKTLLVATTIRHDLGVGVHSPPAVLTTRGGQYQLYASEDASVATAAAMPQCSLYMPPHFAGGIFVGAASRISKIGVGSC